MLPARSCARRSHFKAFSDRLLSIYLVQAGLRDRQVAGCSGSPTLAIHRHLWTFIPIYAHISTAVHKRMRGDGKPKRPCNVVLEEEQRELLELLSEANQIGRPTVSSIVRQAISEFLERQRSENAAFRELVERRKQRPKLLSIATRRTAPGEQGS
jgi:hypothetical protein